MDDAIGAEQVRVTWLDCNCAEAQGFTSKYCDDHHARGTLVPLAMLRDPVGWMQAHDAEIMAAAWDQGFDAAEEDWQHHDEAGWGDEECTPRTVNPYKPSEDSIAAHGVVARPALVRGKGTFEPNPDWGQR